MTIRTKLQGMALLLIIITLLAFALRQTTLTDVVEGWRTTREVNDVRADAAVLVTREMAGRSDDALLLQLDRGAARAAALLQARYPRAASGLEAGWADLRQAVVQARLGQPGLALSDHTAAAGRSKDGLLRELVRGLACCQVAGDGRAVGWYLRELQRDAPGEKWIADELALWPGKASEP